MRAYKRQHGFTLTEVLVATAIFTIIMLAALLMYDRNNRVFKSGVQASDVQQNTRIGFDKLVSDLRIEGFDYNRNGDVSGSDEATGINYQKQPDEQIEYMGSSAIAFRANFNYNTGYDNGREGDKRTAGKPTDTYESPAFPLVTTSNKEIVIYALKSAKASANTSVISFYADVSKPRAAYVGAGGTPKEKLVNITGYDTTNNNPPYTLYRLTLKDANLADSDPKPVDDGDAVPIATNVRSLKFIYYTDQGGTAPDPNIGITPVNGAGQYDAANAQNAIPERLTRATIQAVRVELIGMESAPDTNYSSPLETSTGITDTAGVPAARYRQYQLTSLIVPRNVGKRAVKEEQLKQPQPATLKTVCYGACSVPYLTWQAPKDGNVDFYAIVYDVDNTPGGTCANCSFSNGYPVGNVTESYFPRPLSPANKYFFKIEASNGYGDSLSQETASIYALNTTTPNPATSGTVTTNLNNRVRLTWQTPAYYTGTPSLTCFDATGSPAGSNAVAQNGIAPPEAIAYRVYRAQGAANASFDPSSGQGELIASETNGNQPYVDINGVATLDDIVPACTDFYYRIQAVAADCANNKDYNSPAQTSVALSDFLPKVGSQALHGKATSAAPPAAPQNFVVTRPAACPAAGTLRGANVTCNLVLTWDKVTQDTSSPAQPVKIDNYILTRTPIKPATGSAVTINIPGQWDTLQAGNGGNSITYTDANLPMTDAAGRSYQYSYSLVADTNLCSATSAAATATKPTNYFNVSGEPVAATTSDGGDGSLNNFYQLYGGSSTLSFTAPGLTGLTVYINAPNGTQIATYTSSASPYVFTIPTGLSTGQTFSVDFVATNGSGYYTETVYFQQQGGVCDYKTAPAPVPSATQVTNGTSGAPWTLQPGQTIKWTAADLASASISIIDTTNNSVVKTFTPTGTTETITWPTLVYNRIYEVDAVLTSNVSCQHEQFYFVKQVCAAYGGGTPVFTVADATHTGLTAASAWQVITSGTVKVTESSMASLSLTVTDLTANKLYTTATYNATLGVATITWPPTNVTAAQNHVFQMDIVLLDTNGCASSTYTRYVTQYCTYSGSAPTVAATQTLRNTTDVLGDGLSSTTPFQMVPNVDMITLTDSKIAVAYIDYLDTNDNALAGVSTKTWTGSSPLKFSNPVISSYNGKTFKIAITLADSNGCKTAVTYKYFVKQVPCVLKPQQTSTDTAIIANPVNLHGAGGNYSTVVTLFNKTSQSITINSVKLTFGALGGTNQIQDVAFASGAAVAVNSATSPQTVTAPSGNTIAANGSATFTIDYNYKPGSNPLTSVCVTYTTSTATPTTTVTQSCNIQYSASASVSNPAGCD